MNEPEIEKLAALENHHWWYKERRAVLGGIINKIGLSGKALDIGAASGGNTQVLTANGWQATALDFSAAGPRLCYGRGLPAVQADATRLPFGASSFDMVVAYDVLEHIPDDVRAVREVHRVLRPRGHFLVAVPADPALWSAHDDAVEHVRRYTSETLATLISEGGFEITRLWNWNVLMKPVLKLRRRNLKGSDLDEVSPLLNSALAGVISLERVLPRLSRLPGVSLFLEAQAMGGERPPTPSRVSS